MLKINTYSQGLTALKHMVVSQSSIVKNHTERLGLSFAISVLAAAGAILGSAGAAAAGVECIQVCPHNISNQTCKKICDHACDGGSCDFPDICVVNCRPG